MTQFFINCNLLRKNPFRKFSKKKEGLQHNPNFSQKTKKISYCNIDQILQDEESVHIFLPLPFLI